MAKDVDAISNLILRRFEEAALGEYPLSSMDRELGYSMEPMAAIAAMRIREMVEADPLPTAITRLPADGARVFAVNGTPSISVFDRVGLNGRPIVTLSVAIGGNRLLSADFDPLDATIATAHCTAGHETDLFDFLDRIRALAPATPLRHGNLPIRTRYADELALVEADGGLPGDTCRLLILSMYRVSATRVLADATLALPAIFEAQKAGGFSWPVKFLRFEDFDRHSFAVPIPGHSAVFFRDIDVCADTNSILIARNESEILVWGIDRERDDAFGMIEAATRGVEHLPPPDLRGEIDGKTMPLREPSNASQVVPLLHYGMKSMARAFSNLQATLEDGGTEVVTDFDEFKRGWNPEFDGSPSP